ncbi:TPA: hypothetical protein ACH3X2_004247 [Trebouxia sp. C0005]
MHLFLCEFEPIGCVNALKKHFNFPVSRLSAHTHQRCQAAGGLWRTSQVPHHVRPLTSCAQEPHKSAQKLYGRQAYSIRGNADSLPQQQRLQLDARPNISLLADKLQEQWYEKLNMHLGDILIRPSSKHKVWWSCGQRPDGFPHMWEATVRTRTYGTG